MQYHGTVKSSRGVACGRNRQVLSNASDHLPAGAGVKAIHWLHIPGERGRCIASLGRYGYSVGLHYD